MESKYSLTVIIPTYNTEEYLKRCIESVLNQSLKEIKLLVVNDASTDKTLSILSEFKDNCRVEIITNSHNLGQGESRNIGIEMINTEYFCFWIVMIGLILLHMKQGSRLLHTIKTVI